MPAEIQAVLDDFCYLLSSAFHMSMFISSIECKVNFADYLSFEFSNRPF